MRGKLTIISMFFLCLWNIAVASTPAFSESYLEDGIRQAMQVDDPCLHAGSAATSAEPDDCDCDPNNCQNEHCKYHQCRFGSCALLVKGALAAVILMQKPSFFFRSDEAIESVSPSGLIRPPIA